MSLANEGETIPDKTKIIMTRGGNVRNRPFLPFLLLKIKIKVTRMGNRHNRRLSLLFFDGQKTILT